MSKKKISYESALKELQAIVSQLQEESIGMDDLSAKVARGAELIEFCKTELRKTEQQLSDLF